MNKNHRDWSDMLYEKLSAEFAEYKQWLISLDKGEMLNHASEYSTKQDIVLHSLSGGIDDETIQILLTSDTLLDDIFDALPSYMRSWKYTLDDAFQTTAERLYVPDYDREI